MNVKTNLKPVIQITHSMTVLQLRWDWEKHCGDYLKKHLINIEELLVY